MQAKNYANVKKILLSLAQHVNEKGIRGLASYLGVPASSLYSWISRGKIVDKAIILKKIPNARIEWLETGEGEMFNVGGSGGKYSEAEPGHRDVVTEKEAEWLRSTIPPSGNLSKREEQLVKMFRYLTDHNSQLAQTVWEDVVEAFLDAHGDGATPGK